MAFDHEQVARQLRDQAIDSVEAHADEVWFEQAWAILQTYCRSFRGYRFTAPGFYVYAQKSQGLPRAREARALGALFRKAAREGIVENTGEFEPSVLPWQHLRPVAVWRVL